MTQEQVDDLTQSRCPRCRRWQPDLDKYGVLKCVHCDYCQLLPARRRHAGRRQPADMQPVQQGASMTADDPHLIPRVRQTLQWHAEGSSSPAMLAVLVADAATLLDRLEKLTDDYEMLMQRDHSNSALEVIRADDAARQLATKDALIRALSVRTEEQSQLLSKRAEK